MIWFAQPCIVSTRREWGARIAYTGLDIATPGDFVEVAGPGGERFSTRLNLLKWDVMEGDCYIEGWSIEDPLPDLFCQTRRRAESATLADSVARLERQVATLIEKLDR